jgi:myo-inositol-1(or 4)-monophosphatase
MSRYHDLERIREALERATQVLAGFPAATLEVARKPGGDPVTEADRSVNEVLRACLPRGDEGWLSEETSDDPVRLGRRRVWIVDPLDGTREFVTGIPEWAVSIGLVEDGRAVAGGVLNPAQGQWFLGSDETGVTMNGRPVRASSSARLESAVVLASRSELGRGEWARFDGQPFRVRPCGSVAYKLAQVAAGLADATWSLVPKHEWDVAAGVALVRAAGGTAFQLDGTEPAFNQRSPRLAGLVATGCGLRGPVAKLLGISG